MKVKVVSLFDGISCGRLALERAGVQVDTYYASEIEASSIVISKKNYPDIIQLGDVTQWREWDIPWGEIDLLIGGSPCQGFSFAGRQLNFDDPRSKLFFEFVDILRHIQSLNPKVMFLLENVKMKQVYQDVITRYLGVTPILLDSAEVSAQTRKRLYWTNIGDISELPHKDITLGDVFNPHTEHKEVFIKHPETMVKRRNYIQYDQNYTGHNSQNQRLHFLTGKSGTLLFSSSSIPKVEYGGRYWMFTPEECEVLQTVPVGYTAVEGVSNSRRYEALGNGWTVDVIAHIFSHIPKQETNSSTSKWLYDLLGIGSR